MPEPRERLTALIAKALHDEGCGCDDYYPTVDDHPTPYATLAAAVMELFPDVELAHEHHSPGLILPVAPYIPGQVRATHSLYVLRTEAIPLTTTEETP